jgi:hypothetical protein
VTGVPAGFLTKITVAAAAAAATGWGMKLAIGVRHPVWAAVFILGPYGVVYFAMAALLGVRESSAVLRRLTRIR